MTPAEWGPIPERSAAWPWSWCPDCRRMAGQLHTAACGALDVDPGEPSDFVLDVIEGRSA